VARDPATRGPDDEGRHSGPGSAKTRDGAGEAPVPLRSPCEDGPARGGSDAAGDGGGGGLAVTDATAPTNTALDLAMARIGDRWSLLIVDALLDTPKRFSELEQAIPGLAPNVLSARLRKLEEEGLVSAAAYSDRPPRYEYRVSDAARDLAGALRLLSRWGARNSPDEIEGPRHRSCGTPLEARWYCPTCARVTDQADDDIVWM